MSCRKPCPSCPFRKDQDATDIPNFRLELAERLTDTTETRVGAAIFACHQSRPEQEVPCVGWMVTHGRDSIAVRLGLLLGDYAPEMLEAGEGWPELHASYDEVLEKLRATAHEGG